MSRRKKRRASPRSTKPARLRLRAKLLDQVDQDKLEVALWMVAKRLQAEKEREEKNNKPS